MNSCFCSTSDLFRNAFLPRDNLPAKGAYLVKTVPVQKSANSKDAEDKTLVL